MLVLTSSAIVLVSEVVATRVIAPYAGVTLETFSAVIGCVLAGVSMGNWAGGWLADRVSVREVCAGALALGGLYLMGSPHIIRAIGPHVAAGPVGALTLSAGGFLLPSVALSAITPAVLKALGQGSRRLGSVAGAVSAIGTGGALLGTFGTGFMLVGKLRSGHILVLSGAACLLLAAATMLVLGRSGPTRFGAAGALLVAGLGGWQVGAQIPCDAETKYVCLNIDRIAPSTFLTRSNIYGTSITNVAKPRDLQVEYVRDIATIVETSVPGRDRRLRLGYLGGGGYTLPLYFEATYPSASHVVYEIDGELVERVAAVLGIENLQARFPTRVGDARTEVARSQSGSADVLIGDAFSGLSVPWHLTTAEFLQDVARVLAPNGLYVMNLIDYGRYDLARAQALTFRAAFGNVAVVAPRGVFAGLRRGESNFLLIAGVPDIPALNQALGRAGSGSVAIGGAELSDFVGGATVLTDEFAPVDQLLGRR